MLSRVCSKACSDRLGEEDALQPPPIQTFEPLDLTQVDARNKTLFEECSAKVGAGDGGDGDSADKRVKRLGEKMKLGGRLKQLGYGQSSNRKIRKLLKSRRVYVNGVVETNISRKVTEDFEVTVLTADSGEAETILPTLPKIFVYNKPCGVVSSFNGDLGRLDLAQSLPKEILRKLTSPDKIQTLKLKFTQ